MEVSGRMRLSLVIVGGLIGTLLLVAQVSAGAQSTLNVGSATIAPGDRATVNVTANVPSPGLGAWTVDVNVQTPSDVSIVSCTAESHSVCNPDFDASLPTARFAGASATALTGQITLGTVTVRCASTEGSSVLGLDTVGFADATLGGPVEIPVTFSPGTIRCSRTAATDTAGGTSTPGGVAATPTSAVGGLPTTGSGAADDASTLPLMIAALAGVGLAGIAGYRVLSLRARRA